MIMAKTISLKNAKNAPKTIYMVFINMGGLVHDKVHTLRLKPSDEGLHYWDSTGNYDIVISKDHSYNTLPSVKLDEVIKCNCVWKFVSDKKENAELFLKGATASLAFMGYTWINSYSKTKK